LGSWVACWVGGFENAKHKAQVRREHETSESVATLVQLFSQQQALRQLAHTCLQLQHAVSSRSLVTHQPRQGVRSPQYVQLYVPSVKDPEAGLTTCTDSPWEVPGTSLDSELEISRPQSRLAGRRQPPPACTCHKRRGGHHAAVSHGSQPNAATSARARTPRLLRTQ
jgi:hypothetical protein